MSSDEHPLLRSLRGGDRRSIGQADAAVRAALEDAACAEVLWQGLIGPAEPVVRYEHEAPGQMLHIDTKKLGRIERPSHRVTGNRRDSEPVNEIPG